MAAHLILASASPRRRELLARLGVAFEVVVADIVEHEDPSTDPREMVARNAAMKADWVARRHPDAWVLGADTTVYIDGVALNKPADMTVARAMLKRLSGKTHTVFTGVALRCARRGVAADVGEVTEVRFKPLDDALIDAYFARVNPLDKAGGYAIQEAGSLIIEGRKGSLSNVIGLPLEAVRRLFIAHGLLAADAPAVS